MSQSNWQAYQSVNRLFAQSVAEEAADGDLVWIQDYHLFLCPQILRNELRIRGIKKVKIGFFLHTVFPASDFFRILPVRRDILTGLLNCDVIGFHNPDYTEHFLDCCRKIM
jgi:trehalose 6-phosphate synthase